MEGRQAALHRKRFGLETGAVRKDWGGRLSVALAYPNSYALGMSSLGFQIVYGILNRDDRVVAERVFYPDKPETSLPPEGGKGILSMESLSPLSRFDLIAFSLSFENDDPHVLRMLDWARIPVLQEDRDDAHPFVLGGGIRAMLNPEPLAPFFDAFLLGEAEAVLQRFIFLFRESADAGLDRRETTRRLASEIPSLYVSSLYRPRYQSDGTLEVLEPLENGVPDRIRPARDPESRAPGVSMITTPETEFGEKVLVELGRGCGRACRFCAAGHIYRPPRFRPESELKACVDRALSVTPRVGLLSPAVSDTPGIEALTARIVDRGGTFSVSSLRADSLSPKLLEHLARAGQKSIAIAPEAGTERLRRVINKHLTEEEILGAVRNIASVRGFSLKLYFMIGLPTETREDVAGITDLAKRIRHNMVQESGGRGTVGRIRLSVNCFVPKPFTPFQWFPMEPVKSLKLKQRQIRQALARTGGVTVTFDVPRWAYIQALLSLGDRRAGKILLAAHRFGGDWKEAFRRSEVNPDFFVHRPRGLDEILPWDHIDHGIRKEYLAGEYERALAEKESPECRVGRCDRCGMCPEPVAVLE
ncbi:MAG: radical SAM protein [Deltaproteobacteria bacterium]|nr:radical SAM protein [Deltaproteobacteria bacterium]